MFVCYRCHGRFVQLFQPSYAHHYADDLAGSARRHRKQCGSIQLGNYLRPRLPVQLLWLQGKSPDVFIHWVIWIGERTIIESLSHRNRYWVYRIKSYRLLLYRGKGILVSVSAVVYIWILVSDRISACPYRPFSNVDIFHVCGCSFLLSSLCNLTALRTKTSTYRPRSLAVSGPTSWNSLPQSFRDATPTLGQFQRRLKSSLFRLAYGRDMTVHSWPSRLLDRHSIYVRTDLNW